MRCGPACDGDATTPPLSYVPSAPPPYNTPHTHTIPPSASASLFSAPTLAPIPVLITPSVAFINVTITLLYRLDVQPLLFSALLIYRFSSSSLPLPTA